MGEDHLERKISRRSLFGGGFVARERRDSRNDGYGGGNDEFLMLGVAAQPTAPASEDRPIQVERSFARSNIQAIILHLVRNGVAEGHG